MAAKSPIRYVFDNSGNITEFSEFQSADFVAIADGGTGAITASGARTALGLEIGVDVQAYDAELQALSGLTPTDGNFIVGNGTTFINESGSTARDSLGLGTSDSVQFSTILTSNFTIAGASLTLEGATDDSFETTLTVADPTADRTITFQDGTGTVAFLSDVQASDTLAEMGDVTFTSLANGDFLRYDGSGWINDPVNLSTDTIGDYVQNLVAGTGITVSVTSGEGQTPTVAIDNTVLTSSNTTDDITEGSSNLYFTAERVDDRVGALLVDSSTSGIDIDYDDTNNQLTLSVDLPEVEDSLEDIVNGLIVGGTGITATYDDTAGTLTLTIPQEVGTTSDVTFNQVTADLVGNVTGTVSSLSNHDTDSLTEGSSNLYFTNARARGAVSATDSGGDGSFAYDNSTGVFTYTGPSASEVRAHITGGTGVTISSGEIAIGQSVGTTDNVTFNNIDADGNVVIDGNLTVSGTTTTVNTETINLADNVITLNSNATGSASQNGGLEIERGDDSNKTFLWNETDDKWTIGSETFVAGTFEGALTGNVTGTVSSISNHDTDSLSEGSTNLYYTDARVSTYLTGGTGITESSGTISIDFSEFDTDNMTEGSTNLYHTAARARVALSGSTGITYDNSTGAISIDGTVVTETSTDTLTNKTINFENNTAIIEYAVTVSNASGGNKFYLDGQLASTVQLIPGVTYRFDTSDSSTSGHPFALSETKDGTHNSGSAYTTGVTTNGSQGSSGAYTQIVVDGMTPNLYYYCTAHSGMGNDGMLRVKTQDTDDVSEGSSNLYYTDARAQAAITGSTGINVSSGAVSIDSTVVTETSTDTLTNKTINFENNTAIVEFAVTVANPGSGNRYYLDGELNASIQLIPGITYRFDTSDSSVSGHPLLLSTTKNGTHGSGSNYTTGVTTNGTPGSSGAYTQIVVDAATADTLYYYCQHHSGMGGDAVVSVAGSSLSASTTDNLTEGSSNLYYTDARSRGAVSVTDSGGDGSLAYNSSTGVFTYTGPSASEVRAHITAGTGVTISSGEVAIGQAVGTTSNVTFNDLIVSGNLTVSGTTTTVNTETINLADNLITLNSNATGSASENGGIEIERGDDSNKTLIWNETDDKWTIGSETFVAGTVEAALTGNVTGNVTGTVSSISNHDTDSLSEGSSNLYYTDTRFDTRLGTKDTDDLSEGSTNLYYTDARAQAVSINNVVEDTTPQLGGNLDLNSSDITGTGNIDTTGDITITSTADTSAAGPIINLVRDSASPADADYLGQIKFKGDDDGGASTVYAKITGKIDDASAGTEDGLIEFATIKAGSSNIAARLKTTNFQLLNGTGLEVAGNTTLSGTLNTHTVPSGTGTIALTSDIPSDTDGLSEGSSNLYYTNTRADARIALANLQDLANVGFSAPGSNENQKVVSWDNSAGAFVLSSVSGLSGSGETNTASNVGTAGVGVFKQKSGEDLELKKINAGSAKITITDDTSNDEVDIDFGTVSIDDLSDVDTTSSAPSNGQALKWNNSASQWEPGDASSQVAQLTDVTLTSLATGELLQYSGSAWVNATLDTSDVSEHSSNLYYTDARVQSYLSGGTGVTMSGSGEFSIGQAVATTSNVTFNDLIVSGNLTVSGTTTTVNTETINLADNVIVLNSNATGSASENGGIEIERGDDTNKTLIWNESTDKWTVGSETFVAGTFEGNATGLTTAAITSLTEDTSPAETDLIVVYDGSAGALKKVAKSNFAASATFSVNDEMPLTLADASSDPIEFTNVGTSGTDIDLVLADGTSDPINITGTSNSATVFRDGDTDTFIKVEDSSDDDTIRMHTAGSERFKIDNTGEATATLTWETGTFTATIYYSTTLTTTGAFDSGNWTTATATANYTKIGNLYKVNYPAITRSSLGVSSDFIVTAVSLPVTASSTYRGIHQLAGYGLGSRYNNSQLNHPDLIAEIAPSATTVNLYGLDTERGGSGYIEVGQTSNGSLRIAVDVIA